MSAPSLAVTQKAYFAGGCFWCMEATFEKVPGVSEVLSGYMDGADQKPTYKTYAKSGHVEAIEVQYDPRKVSYAQLLNTFWKNIDPTDPDGQFVDRGPQYRAVIFYQNETEKDQAEQSKKALSNSKRFAKPIVTEIKKASTFYPAEKDHQNYYEYNPGLYWWYTSGSGRKEFFQKHWNKMSTPQNNPTYAKPSDAELRKKLTPLQYRVTQQGATEPPHKNEYNLLMEPGIYVDIVSGEPLFSSKDKFISKSGWPSFSRPLVPENVIEKGRWFRSGKEVRSKHADSHLGDVFSGEDTETGSRYCINSAALRFIPANELQKEGYGSFANSISND